jgi:hypothetical protein
MSGETESGSERPNETGGSRRPAVYDSFVVRLWRTPGIDLVRRVEVEHVQSGVVASAGDVALAWVLAQLDGALGAETDLIAPPSGTVPPPD